MSPGSFPKAAAAWLNQFELVSRGLLGVLYAVERAKELAQTFSPLFFSIGIFSLHTAVNPFEEVGDYCEREMVYRFLFQVCVDLLGFAMKEVLQIKEL